MARCFRVFLTVSLLTLISCNTQESSHVNTTEDKASTAKAVEYPEILQQALEAHGGLSRWRSFEKLEYDVYRDGEPVDHQLIALRSRKVLIEHEQYNIGFDGQQVWVSPDTSAYPGASARFYHNLQFYFFALPFVLADPGIQYEELAPRVFEGTTYDVLKISYQSDVGDAPDDEYIAYFNSSTHQLHLLLYTVTYFSQEPGKNYNARVYKDWQQIKGLTVPHRVIGYRWEDDSLGEKRSTNEYQNIVLDETPPDQSIFLMPDEATVSED